jgi:hypothetical protein
MNKACSLHELPRICINDKKVTTGKLPEKILENSTKEEQDEQGYTQGRWLDVTYIEGFG